jgi:protein lysine acetyltransferase
MTLHMRRRDPLLDLDLFSGCTPAEVRSVRSLLTMLTVSEGSVLMAEGSYGYEFLVIADGEARVTLQTPDGESPVAVLRRGDFAGEMSLLGDRRRTATVTAVTPVTIYVCNAAEFAGILDDAPSVAAKVTHAADARREANRQLAAAA